ncbi:MAG TPA: DNA-binding response regulator [Ruminococcus sp.]|nr:DNA-binding response regulator [Ruminococcus sp.]
MRIAVCDDEQRFLDDISGIIEDIYKSLDIITERFTDGNELLKSFRSAPYDLVFLDIEMPDMDGISLAEKLREMSNEVSIVFLTGHVEYAINGYEVNALRYLTKPADRRKVKDVIDKVMGDLNKDKIIWIRTDMGEMKLKLSDILFIESQNQNVVINTSLDSYSVRGNMNDYEANLTPEGFFRIHRSYLVSLGKIQRVSEKDVIMDDGTSLPVSRSKRTALKDVLFSYMDREAF